MSKLKKIVFLFTIVTEASKEMILLQYFLKELGYKYEKSKLHCDNHSAIRLANYDLIWLIFEDEI